MDGWMDGWMDGKMRGERVLGLGPGCTGFY